MRWRPASVLLVAFVMASASRAGVPPTFDDVRSWALMEWSRAARKSDLSGVVLRWRLEQHEVPPQEVLAAMRLETANRPDHPGRAQLSVFERRLVNGPDVTDFTLWWQGELWRLNRDGVPLIGAFDLALAGDVCWRMNRQQISLERSDPASPPPDFRAEQETFQRWVGFFLFSGIPLAHSFRLEPDAVTREGEDWVLVARSEGVAMSFAGPWSSEAKRVLFREVAIEQADAAPDEVGHRWMFDGWHEDATLGQWLPRRVVEYLSDGRKSEVLILTGVERDPRPIKELVRIPEIGGLDAVRGRIEAEELRDARGERVLIAIRDEHGNMQNIVAPEDPARRNERFAGYAAIVCIIGVLVVFIGAKLKRRT